MRQTETCGQVPQIIEAFLVFYCKKQHLTSKYAICLRLTLPRLTLPCVSLSLYCPLAGEDLSVHTEIWGVGGGGPFEREVVRISTLLPSTNQTTSTGNSHVHASFHTYMHLHESARTCTPVYTPTRTCINVCTHMTFRTITGICIYMNYTNLFSFAFLHCIILITLHTFFPFYHILFFLFHLSCFYLFIISLLHFSTSVRNSKCCHDNI